MIFAGKNLYLIAVDQFVAHGHQLVVHLDGDAVVADVGVDVESKIQGGGSFGQHFHVSFGGIDVDFLLEQAVVLEVSHKLDGVAVGVVQYFAYTVQPTLVHVGLVVDTLVLPVGRIATF